MAQVTITGTIRQIGKTQDVSDKFKEMPNGAEKTALAMKLFGKAGADMADAVVVRGRSTSVSVRLGKVEATEASESDDMSLRVFVGQRVASVSANGDADFDVLITCAFNYDAHSSEFKKLGRIPVLKARMNADLHMADDLKNTGKGNLFVIFGEPDISLLRQDDGKMHIKVNGVDVFKPQTGEVVSNGADGIACWFIDTDYNEESFFVRHAYFLGASDPYKSLKTTLKADINAEAWESLNSDTSRPFGKPTSGRIAVKVINHLGDEVMKVFRVV